MKENGQKRHLIIHGHFYQPPRENPWTERIDRQESAAPYHDWNERIAAECYLPNARSRRLDGYGRILSLVNNYEHISFNFGPTLMSWIARHEPELLGQIVEADALSAQRRGGHGNAIAQVYNHIIMPLAERRDQETEIRWGVHDFRARFGREPEGIWLAETAINEAVLELLIDFRFRFIILSPFQADRVRPIDGGKWDDVSNGSILTGMPYRCFGSRKSRSRKRFIDIFFYDSQLSTDVSFNHLCRNGDSLADSILAAYGRTGGDLVAIATDGEIYGHHEPFADMALSYLIDVAAKQRGIEMTNFPAYLDSHEPAFEVQIKQGSNGEGTAWSCSHGVGRWKEDCGCSTGSSAGWNQKWRAPLRMGLDTLRGSLAAGFESEGAALLSDPWKARDEYINVIIERSSAAAESFVRERAARELSAGETSRAMSLLEAQRNALLMFTSCGWFFSDISGIETTQLMKYAARAAALAGGDGAEVLESPLLEELEKAKSNLDKYGTGADLYRTAKKYSAVDAAFLAGQHVLSNHLGCPDASPAAFGYEFDEIEGDWIEFDGESIRTGLFSMASPFSLERHLFAYALLIGAPSRVMCVLKEASGQQEYQELRARLDAMPDGSDRAEILRKVTELLGGRVFAMRDLFPEDRESILGKIAARQVDELEKGLERLYLADRDLLRLFSETRIEAPAVIRVPAETVLSRRLERELDDWERNLDTSGLQGVREILSEATYYGVRLDKSKVSGMFTELLIEALAGSADGLDEQVLTTMIEFVAFSDDAGVELQMHGVQNAIFEIMTGPLEAALGRIEKLQPGSEREIGSVKAVLALAKRFNYNVDALEERLPIR